MGAREARKKKIERKIGYRHKSLPLAKTSAENRYLGEGGKWGGECHVLGLIVLTQHGLDDNNDFYEEANSIWLTTLACSSMEST